MFESMGRFDALCSFSIRVGSAVPCLRMLIYAACSSNATIDCSSALIILPEGLLFGIILLDYKLMVRVDVLCIYCYYLLKRALTKDRSY